VTDHDASKLTGIVEVDETFTGGKEGNDHESKKLHAGHGSVGKQAVIDLRERGGRSIAKPIDGTDQRTLHAEIEAHVEPGSMVYTDGHQGYSGLLDYQHESVCHIGSTREMSRFTPWFGWRRLWP
jgi:transposase-like protein